MEELSIWKYVPLVLKEWALESGIIIIPFVNLRAESWKVYLDRHINM